MPFQSICITFFCTPDDQLGEAYLNTDGTEDLGLMCKGRTLTHTWSWNSILLPFLLLQQLLETLRRVTSSVCHYLFLKGVEKNPPENKERKGWMFGINPLSLVQLAQAHTVRVKEGLRELHTWFLSSEWICLHVENVALFSHRRNCNSEFYYFWANSSGIVFKSLLLLIQLTYCFVFTLNCMSWQCSADLVAHILFLYVLSLLATLVFQSALLFPFTPSFTFQPLWPPLLFPTL